MRYGWNAADVVSGVVIRTSVSCIVIGSSGVGLRIAVLAACKNIVVLVVLVVAAAAGGRCAAGGPGGARAVGSRVALPEILEDKAHPLSISELANMNGISLTLAAALLLEPPAPAGLLFGVLLLLLLARTLDFPELLLAVLVLSALLAVSVVVLSVPAWVWPPLSRTVTVFVTLASVTVTVVVTTSVP